MINPAIIKKNACTAESALLNENNKGAVQSVPNIPNAISKGLRPIRSYNAPKRGCMVTNTSNAIKEISVDSPFVR